MKIVTISGEELEVGNRFKDLTGQVFGRLTVIGLSYVHDKRTYWLCQCECGGQSAVQGGNLRSGHTTSCGCLQREAASLAKTKHGLCGHPAYKSWENMLTRCTNPKVENYADYGGRGITVCEQWRTFEDFWTDMGPTWVSGLTLDRIDVNGDYCTENCRWLEQAKQVRNQRKQKNNTSGVTGVCYDAKRGSWLATWNDLNGARKGKTFLVKKYGYEPAFYLACEYRGKMIEELNRQGANYTEQHGK